MFSSSLVVLAVTIQRQGVVTLLQYCTPFKPRMFLLFVVVLPLLRSTALLLELSPSQIHRVHHVFVCVESWSGCVRVCICVCWSISVQCSELVLSKEKLGRVNSLELLMGLGEPLS